MNDQERLIREVTDTAAKTWLLDAELGASWDGIRDRLLAALREAKAEGEQHVRSLPPTPNPVPSPWGVDKRWLDDQAARLASVIIQQRTPVAIPPNALDIAKEWVGLFMQGLLDQRVKRRRTAESDKHLTIHDLRKAYAQLEQQRAYESVGAITLREATDT